MNKLIARVKQLSQVPWLAESLTILGGIIYSLQIWIYAHTQDSVLDEGLFLLKGYLFTIGKYKPFQYYGPLTNKMPLAFLIPGYVQVLFQPGLRTGRYFAIFLAVLYLVGVWIVAQRLGGKSPRGDASRWWGAGAVFMIALNPANLKLYSIMVSQGLVATMLIWVLVLTLGEKRPWWQLVLGACLAGLLPLTRVNMVIVIPFVLGYIFWEHGLWMGILSSLVSTVTFVGGHVFFWPGILSIWLPWIPAKLTPFLGTWYPDHNIGELLLVGGRASFRSRVMAFFEGVRHHFSALVGAMVTWLLWPRKWSKPSRFRVAVFLSALFASLFVMHVWAALIKSPSVFGFSVYLSFFEILGILLVVVSSKNWRWELPFWRRYTAFGLMAIIILGIGYTAANKRTLPWIILKWILRHRAIRVDDGRILLAPWQWWEVLESKFGWPFLDVLSVSSQLILIILAVGILVLAVKVLSQKSGARLLKPRGFWRLRKSLPQNIDKIPKTIASLSLVLMLIGGTLASPLEVLGGGRHNFDCERETITSYEEAAEHISKYVQPGGSVYWSGGDTQSVLLELGDDIELFPQQLNSSFTYRPGYNTELLAKYGYWNDELNQQWLREADILLIEERVLGDWLLDYINHPESMLDEVTSTAPIGCRDGANIKVYRREASE